MIRFLIAIFFVGISCAYATDIPVPDGCSYTSQTCTIKGGTRVINGVKVELPCWQYAQVFTCTKTPAVDNCKVLEDQKCNLQGQKCLDTIAGFCVEYDYQFSCSEKTCTKQDFKCGKPAFCMDGDCYTSDKQKQPPDQMGKDAAIMAAAQDAASHTQKNADGSIEIFAGKRMGCSVAIAGSNNCCGNEHGWNPVGSCSADEKQLQKLKEKHVVIDNGDFCKNKTLGVCTSKEHPSCVYDSLMTKDIIEQGVIGQLYHGSITAYYGDPENTHCKGITPEQLQKIDFDKIDMSNIEDDIKKHMNVPDSGGSSSDAEKQAKCLQETGNPCPK